MNNNKFKILEVLDLAWGGKAIIMQAKDCELHIFLIMLFTIQEFIIKNSIWIIEVVFLTLTIFRIHNLLVK